MKITIALTAIAALLTAGPAVAQSPADAVKGFGNVLVEGRQPPGSSGLPALVTAAIEDSKGFDNVLVEGRQQPGSSSVLPAPAKAAIEDIKGFSIVLVEGSQQPGTSSDLPAPAKAAIEDIKDFLPFKSFRLLDASWMAREVNIVHVGATDVRSRLSDGGRDYEVAVAVTRQAEAKNLAIRFTLRDVSNPLATPASSPRPDAGSAEYLRGQLDGLRARLRTEYEQLQALREKYAEGHPSVQAAEQSIRANRERLAILEKQEVESLRRASDNLSRGAAGGARLSNAALIDTSFSMRVGETVVVGTSRVNGDRALIALMTAVSKEPVVVPRQF